MQAKHNESDSATAMALLMLEARALVDGTTLRLKRPTALTARLDSYRVYLTLWAMIAAMKSY